MKSINVNSLDNSTPLSDEEGYLITQYYVHYYWSTGKFYSLKSTMEEDDAINEVYLKLLKHSHFSKYDPSIATKKYFVCRAVYTTLVDLLRKQRIMISLDQEDYESGLMMVDLVVDETKRIDEEASGKADRDRILSQLPETSRSSVVGIGPDGKEINISYRTLATLLEQGFNTKEIAGMYKNPKNGRCISEGTINKYIHELREFCLDNIVIA